MAFEFTCRKTEELELIAADLIAGFPDQRLFVLSGSMGAGKTTLIQSLCRVLQVVDVVNSPTFSIVNEYLTAEGSSVFHFDLYRLRKEEELLDIGYEDYFYSGSYCFVEWPEMAAGLIPDDCIHIRITVDEISSERTIRAASFTDGGRV